MPSESTPMCTSCGSGMEDERFAQFQAANIEDGQTPMCASCIDTHIESSPQLLSAFDGIADALNAENRREWNNFDFDEKFMRFLYYRKEGHIRPGHGEYDMSQAECIGVGFEELVRLKCAKLQYEDAPVLS